MGSRRAFYEWFKWLFEIEVSWERILFYIEINIMRVGCEEARPSVISQKLNETDRPPAVVKGCGNQRKTENKGEQKQEANFLSKLSIMFLEKIKLVLNLALNKNPF